jgi:hypothetical protein
MADGLPLPLVVKLRERHRRATTSSWAGSGAQGGHVTIRARWRASSLWSLAPELASYDAPTGASAWLGHPLSPQATCDGHLRQYFDKGAIERVRGRSCAGVALVPPLLAAQAALAVGGTRSTVTYPDKL